MSDIPIMLKIHEAAIKFSLPKHFMRQLVLQKRVRFVRAGRVYLINEKSLIDYLNKGDGDE